jgi:outer membrane protein assembly factor BamB
VPSLPTAGGLYAINSNGAIKWICDEVSWIRGSPVIDSNGTVYVLSRGGLAAIDANIILQKPPTKLISKDMYFV